MKAKLADTDRIVSMMTKLHETTQLGKIMKFQKKAAKDAVIKILRLKDWIILIEEDGFLIGNVAQAIGRSESKVAAILDIWSEDDETLSSMMMDFEKFATEQTARIITVPITMVVEKDRCSRLRLLFQDLGYELTAETWGKPIERSVGNNLRSSMCNL